MSVGVVHVHLSARELLGGQQTALGMQASSAIYYFFQLCKYVCDLKCHDIYVKVRGHLAGI